MLQVKNPLDHQVIMIKPRAEEHNRAFGMLLLPKLLPYVIVVHLFSGINAQA